jgi:hypothetical protein
MRIDEVFTMGYDMFGWIESGGKVILATPAMAKSWAEYYHLDISKEKLGVSSMSAAYKNGHVRWFLEHGTLEIENTTLAANEETIINTVSKGIKQIEQLAQNPKKFKHFTGELAREQEPMMIYWYSYTGSSATIPQLFDDTSRQGLINQMKAAESRKKTTKKSMK